jgi:hypothetical protein
MSTPLLDKNILTPLTHTIHLNIDCFMPFLRVLIRTQHKKNPTKHLIKNKYLDLKYKNISRTMTTYYLHLFNWNFSPLPHEKQYPTKHKTNEKQIFNYYFYSIWVYWCHITLLGTSVIFNVGKQSKKLKLIHNFKKQL